jgi:protocatechuate 3,4-dioxygenase beta subunit
MCSTKTAAACRTRWSRLWQANACGRYIHVRRPASRAARSEFHRRRPRAVGREGYYKFVTIKPGAYPWGNHHNAWRPAHIHFSVFGHAFVSRLVTQMYFPGDPLFEFDPIFNSVPDEKARMRMVSSFDLENTQPEWALCYRFNIVLRGRNATPMETK